MADRPTRVDFLNKKVIVEPPPLPVVVPAEKRTISPVLVFLWGSLSAFALCGIIAFVWRMGLGVWLAEHVVPYILPHLSHIVILVLVAVFFGQQWYRNRRPPAPQPPRPVQPRRVPPPDDRPTAA